MNQPSSRLLRALQTNSDSLMRLTSDFRFQLPRYQIVSFYEQRPMNTFSGLVRYNKTPCRCIIYMYIDLEQIVEKHSALLDVDGEEQIPVDANHRDMCKFEGRDNGVYEKVFKRLGRMLKGKDGIQTGGTCT
jgi:hypothetical protein